MVMTEESDGQKKGRWWLATEVASHQRPFLQSLR
jgi:hypothetical protein